MEKKSNNKYKNMFNTIKKFKDELDAETSFDSVTKKIIFEKYVESCFLGGKGKTITNIDEDQNENEFNSKIKASTFASLLNMSKVDSHTEMVLFATYYLVIVQGKENITVNEIEEEYRQAYRKPSTNTSVYVGRNIKAGFMMKSGKKDGSNGYTITHEGINKIKEEIENVK